MRYAHGTKSPLIGIDFSGLCRAVGEQLEREEPERERRRRAAAERVDYVGQHEYFVLVSKLPNHCTKVETIESFPLVGRLSAVGRNLEHALTELRWAYATALVKKRLLPSMDDARAYATRCTFRVSQ